MQESKTNMAIINLVNVKEMAELAGHG